MIVRRVLESSWRLLEGLGGSGRVFTGLQSLNGVYGSGGHFEGPGQGLDGSGRVQEAPRESGRVLDGLGGSRSVMEGPVGSQRVWESPGGLRRIWEGLEGSRRIWKGIGGSCRVWESPERSGSILEGWKDLGRVWEGPVGSVGSGRVQKFLGGLEGS